MSENVGSKYDRPGDILADDNLTDDDKRRLLEDWRLDLLELQRATEENMPPEGPADDRRSTADLLGVISVALEALK